MGITLVGMASHDQRLDAVESGHRIYATPTGGDDTSGLQAVINEAATSGNPGKQLLRSGAYNVTNLTLPVQGSGALEIEGQGPGKTPINCTTRKGSLSPSGTAGRPTLAGNT
jgi:hypothetical protein